MNFSNIKKVLGLSIVGTAVVLMTACGSVVPADKTAPLAVNQVNAESLTVSDIKNTSNEAANEIAKDVSLEKELAPKTEAVETKAETETETTNRQVTAKANEDEANSKSEVLEVPLDNTNGIENKAEDDSKQITLKADTEAANIRKGPGLSFDIIGLAKQDERFEAQGRTADGAWIQVKYADASGWLASSLIKQQSLLSTLPVVEAPVVENSATSNTVENKEAVSNEISDATDGSYVGLGFKLSVNSSSFPTITAIFAGYPIHQAGLRVNDWIMEIDGKNLYTLNYQEVHKLLQGKAGSEVTLKVHHAGNTKIVTLTRTKIDPKNVSLVCNAEPVRGFGTVWRNHIEVQPLLGCVFTNFRRDEHATPAAVQTFEHGWMLWLETDTVANVDPIYVFYEDDGSYIRFGDTPWVDAHSYAPTPDGFYKVGDRFAKVYGEYIGATGRARLGNAINEARDTEGAFQEFANGRMFWANHSDTIYVIYSGYYDFAHNGTPIFERGWTSFEDTFEE